MKNIQLCLQLLKRENDLNNRVGDSEKRLAHGFSEQMYRGLHGQTAIATETQLGEEERTLLWFPPLTNENTQKRIKYNSIVSVPYLIRSQ